MVTNRAIVILERPFSNRTTAEIVMFIPPQGFSACIEIGTLLHKDANDYYSGPIDSCYNLDLVSFPAIRLCGGHGLHPRSGDPEGLLVTEGQEVEVIDSSRAHKWRVRLRKDGTEGNVPSCYLEKKTTVTPPMSPQLDAKAQATIARREKVLKELVESEEAFARDMQYVVNNYIKEMDKKTMPKELRDYKESLFTNFTAISEFHNNVLMKGIQYYADDPSRLGKTF
ncbi:obscurin [Caerostris extrusa]|uniref:Obscurin n=1 Tax=Caerostris extrusa TaxID=172846 RepID=A0AAV4PJH1_CAEEX|nr:obscurin [Caerostris extrusa]